VEDNQHYCVPANNVSVDSLQPFDETLSINSTGKMLVGSLFEQKQGTFPSNQGCFTKRCNNTVGLSA
jgi:hypothetical protein